MKKANPFTLGWIVLAALLALAACQPYMVETQSGAQVLVPAGTVTLEPYPPPPQRPLPLAPSPTAPSDTWPTLTPEPTSTPRPTFPPPPTPKGGFEPTWTPPPSPTRPPLLLTPIPKGEPPADLSSLYYVADNGGEPELRVIGMDTQGRKWLESSIAHGLPLKGSAMLLVGLYPSPDGKYLAAQIAHAGGGYEVVNIVEQSSGRTWCPFTKPANCWGGFYGWTLDNQFLFKPFDVPPKGVTSDDTLVVDPDTGGYRQLGLPTHPRWGYSLVQNISLSSDSQQMAFSTADIEDGEETGEIWIMRIDGGEKRLVDRVKGVINALVWSPVSERLIYSYRPGTGTASTDPSELWILNTDGSNKKLLANNMRMAGERYYRPAWAPDGRHVAFVQVDDVDLFLSNWREPGTNVYVADTVTGQITRLSAFKERNTSFPTWSPDGTFVAFVSSIITNDLEPEAAPIYTEVWVASVDGKQLYTISGIARWYNTLAWLPPVSLQRR